VLGTCFADPANWSWGWGPILCMKEHASLFRVLPLQHVPSKRRQEKQLSSFCYLGLYSDSDSEPPQYFSELIRSSSLALFLCIVSISMEESSYTGLPTSHLLGSVPVSESIFRFSFLICALCLSYRFTSLSACSFVFNCFHIFLGIKLIVCKFSGRSGMKWNYGITSVIGWFHDYKIARAVV